MAQPLSSYQKLMEEVKREYEQLMQKERLFVSPKKLLDFFVPLDDQDTDEDAPRDER